MPVKLFIAAALFISFPVAGYQMGGLLGLAVGIVIDIWIIVNINRLSGIYA